MASKSNFEASHPARINTEIRSNPDLLSPKTEDLKRDEKVRKVAHESIDQSTAVENSSRSASAFLLSCRDIAHGKIESWHEEHQNTCVKCHGIVDQYLSIPLENEEDLQEITFAVELQNFRRVFKSWARDPEGYQEDLIRANEALEKIAHGIPSLVKRLPFYIAD